MEGYVWKHRTSNSYYPFDRPSDREVGVQSTIGSEQNRESLYTGKYVYSQSTNNGGTWTDISGEIAASSLESTWSISHGNAIRKGFLGRQPGGRTVPDIGGDFYNRKTRIANVGTPYASMSRRVTSQILRRYDGPVLAIDPGTLSYPTLGPISNLALAGYGNTAKSRVNPANPNGGLLTAVGELFNEGVPTIVGAQTWKNRIKEHRDLGHEYLNVEFGWKPLVSDIQSTALNVKRAAKLLRQREKNLGKPLRRRYNFPTVTSNGNPTVVLSNNYPSPIGSMGNMGLQRGNVTRTRDLVWDVWFSGCFTYYVSAAQFESSLLRYEKQADILLGTRLTPDVLWNLAPWTWAIDWHVNFGVLLEDLARKLLDGSVMWYGYVMSHQKLVDHYTHSTHPETSFDLITEIKQRARATPFGFGLNPNTDYSMRQLAIIAALGITLT